MPEVRVTVKTHWFNGWFLRMFSRPFVWVEGKETPVEFSCPVSVKVENHEFKIGAGIRYFSQGKLLGCEPETVCLDTASEVSSIVLKNGLWNHSPFSVSKVDSPKRLIQK